MSDDAQRPASRDVEVDIVVVGAGLAGLTAAHELHAQGVRFLVLEGAPRIGGRIGAVLDHSGESPKGTWRGDLGPTWIWPQDQPVVKAWLKRLGLGVAPQFDAGDGLFDASSDAAPRRVSLPLQPGIRRIDGHPQALVDALMTGLPTASVRCGAAVVSVHFDTVATNTRGPAPRTCIVRTRDGARVRCNRVVVAVPPRIAIERIEWLPKLPVALVDALASTPTWMAVQAKAVIAYPHAFWRDAGLSGRVVSAVGPLAEIHDHCGPRGEPAALFGFVGWSASTRDQVGDGLSALIVAQLARCFGEAAASPTLVHVEDWAKNSSICTPRDLAETPQHPQIAPAVLRQAHAGGRLVFAAAETSTLSPGLIEGALHAGVRAAAQCLADGASRA